uniref:CCHC-type domain-containing protein n=1 Tax=Tanacetum cinerariifolium TaxID=118510 RepID=A0A6L2LCU9_TANCI|nr:hypothetical protein [Tanacetum cinerariifolium]
MSSKISVNPPVPNTSTNSNFTLLSVLGRERLTGPNYMDWMRKLRFTLRYENKEYVLDEQIPTINDDTTQDEIKAHQKHYDDANKVSCVMASSMSPELQKTFENTWAYEMNQQLKEMFQAKASKERLDVVKSFMACKPKPRASICAFVLEMKGYFDRLKSLNMVFDTELSINIILSGMPVNYNQFVLSYQKNGKETSIIELHSLLQTAGQGIKKSEEIPHKESLIMGLREVESEIAPTSDPKEAVCFYCNTKGHWKRSCPKYLKDLKDEKFKKCVHSATKDEKRYYITFTDDFSRYGYAYLIKHKSDTFEVFKRYQNEVENQLGRKIKLTPPRTLQLNGVAEMKNRTMLDMVQSMMCLATLPISLWGYALETCTHISNLVPTKKVSKTPFEMWKGKCPSLGHIKIWSCEVFVRREAQDKIEARSEKCLFVGYPEELFGYLFYKPKDDVVFVARRGVFFEREMISKEESGSIIDLEEIQESTDKEPIINTDTQQDVVTLVELDDISLPIHRTSSREVMASLEAAKWKEAMKIKIQSMYDNQMDVKTAFLNEKLTKDVFMAQAEGFENENWNLCFYEKVTQFGFSRSKDESCVYVKVSGSVAVYLVLYVDDVLLIGNDIPKFQNVKDWLRKCFAMKDLGDATYILGIKIYRDRVKCLIGLSQDTYLNKNLKIFRMENSKKGNLPLHHGIKIRSIMYAMTCTRPDVSFALSTVSRHQQNPGEVHPEAWPVHPEVWLAHQENAGNQIGYNVGQIEGNHVGQNVVQNLGVGHYTRNYTVKPRKRDVGYLQTQLQIAKKEAGIQLSHEEFEFMAAIGAYEEIEEVNANCTLKDNLQQTLTSGIYSDNSLVYDQLRVLLEKHDPPDVYDSEETLQLAQESRLKMKQLNKEIKPANYAKINKLSEDTIVTLQRVVKHRINGNVNNLSSPIHQETRKFFKEEIVPIVNQLDVGVQNVENHFLKEVAKFVRDFKSLAKEVDTSLDKITVLEKENEHLLRAVVSQDILSIVQSPSVFETSKLQTELEQVESTTKTRRPQPRRNLKDFRAPSSNTESESGTSVCDNASASNHQEPTRKGFPNSTLFLGRNFLKEHQKHMSTSRSSHKVCIEEDCQPSSDVKFIKILYHVDGGNFIENYGDLWFIVINNPFLEVLADLLPNHEEGERVNGIGRGGRGRRPRGGNDKRVDELNGQGNEQGKGANENVEGVNEGVGNQGDVRNQKGNVVNENVQENVRNVLVKGNRVGYLYKEFLACNPKEYDGKGGVVVLT